jgi:hypothetical protein
MSTIQDETKKTAVTGQEAPEAFQIPEATSSGLSRRRLFKTGLGVAPVVMTLASRPVLAWHCTTPSAFGSINVSHRQTCTTTEFTTYCVAEWNSNCISTTRGAWPSSCPSKTALCSSVLPSGSSVSIKTRLASTDSGSSFERILLAAYLNCKSGYVDPILCITTAQVQNMYQYGKNGLYKPQGVSGPVWSQSQCLNYLKQNWIAVQSTSDWNGTWQCHT